MRYYLRFYEYLRDFVRLFLKYCNKSLVEIITISIIFYLSSTTLLTNLLDEKYARQ